MVIPSATLRYIALWNGLGHRLNLQLKIKVKIKLRNVTKKINKMKSYDELVDSCCARAGCRSAQLRGWIGQDSPLRHL